MCMPGVYVHILKIWRKEEKRERGKKEKKKRNKRHVLLDAGVSLSMNGEVLRSCFYFIFSVARSSTVGFVLPKTINTIYDAKTSNTWPQCILMKTLQCKNKQTNKQKTRKKKEKRYDLFEMSWLSGYIIVMIGLDMSLLLNKRCFCKSLSQRNIYSCHTVQKLNKIKTSSWDVRTSERRRKTEMNIVCFFSLSFSFFALVWLMCHSI